MSIKKLGIVSLFIFVLGAVQPASAMTPRQRVKLAPGASTSGFSALGKPAARGAQGGLSAAEREKIREIMIDLEKGMLTAEQVNKLTREELAEDVSVKIMDMLGTPMLAKEAANLDLVSAGSIKDSLAFNKQLANEVTLKLQKMIQLFLARAQALKDRELIGKIQNGAEALNQWKAQSLQNIDTVFAHVEKLKKQEGLPGGEQSRYTGGSEVAGRREEAMAADVGRAGWGSRAFGSEERRGGEQLLLGAGPRYGQLEGEELEFKEGGEGRATRSAVAAPQKVGGRSRVRLAPGASTSGFSALRPGGKSQAEPKTQPLRRRGSEYGVDVDEWGLPNVPTRKLSAEQPAAASSEAWWAETSRIRPLEPSTRVEEKPSLDVEEMWALSPSQLEQSSIQRGEKLSPRPVAAPQQKSGGRSRVRLAPGASTSGFSAISKKPQSAAPKPLVSAKPGKTLAELEKIADAYAKNWQQYMLDLRSASTASELDNQVAGLSERIEQSIEAAKALNSREGASLAYKFESYQDSLKTEYNRLASQIKEAQGQLGAPQRGPKVLPTEEEFSARFEGLFE